MTSLKKAVYFQSAGAVNAPPVKRSPAESRAPPAIFIQPIAMLVLGCIAAHRRSHELNEALDDLDVARSTRSYHVRSLATKGLITVTQAWHAQYPHVRVYEYELTAVGRILLEATKKAEAEIQVHKASLAYA
jgi:DNA-binding MarR family transcriptional regulator